MELIKFLNDNRRYFNLRKIEEDCGLGDGVLNKVLKGSRKLSNADRLLALFKSFGIPLKHEVVTSSMSVRVGSILPIDGWVQTLGRNFKNGVMRGVLEDGKIRVISV